jgi:hypothetical protein
MADTRGMVGGLCLVVGAVPLALYYGFEPLGYLGAVLAVFGAMVSYGAYTVETV